MGCMLVASGGVKYAYDKDRIIPFQTRRNHYIFKQINILSEPFVYNKQESRSESAFLDDLVREIMDQKICDFLFSPVAGLFSSYPHNSIRIRFGNYVLEIEKSEDEIFEGFTSKHRNMVRRGERSGLKIRFGGMELLDDYLMLDKMTWARSGKMSDNRQEYESILTCLKNYSMIAIAYKDRIPQCGILGIYNEAMFYYMYGASADKPEPGSTHYLQWRTMLYMKEHNVKAYNFVGARINEDPNSKYHAIQHFKKGFGGEMREGYLFKTIINKSKYKLFYKLRALKNRDFVGDVIDQEFHKWTNINE